MDDVRKKLITDLENAETTYRQTPKLGVSQALLAIYSHLGFLDIPPNLSEPIFALIMALDDAERGTNNPLLAVQKLGHRAPFTVAEKQARAHAAAALELLIRSDIPARQAALTVAQTAKNWPWHETKKVNATTISKWRESAMAGLVGEDFDATTFNELIKYAEASQHNYKTIATQLLDSPPWMR
jgi:hypothetical protein